MQPTMTMTTATATDGADAPEGKNNVERAIDIVRSANEEQMKKIIEILFG